MNQDTDLAALYEYGYTTWGEEQADNYSLGLLEHVGSLTGHPYLFQVVDEIKKGYRRSVYLKHAVFYSVSEDTDNFNHGYSGDSESLFCFVATNSRIE
jgi:toxin ParE1/3/4